MDVTIVIWTETALKQRNSIFDYWNKRNGNRNYSRKLNRIINDRINQIQSNPQSGNPSEIPRYRVLAMSNYSLIYRQEQKEIYIVSFWDNRQDRKKLLNLLKNG